MQQAAHETFRINPHSVKQSLIMRALLNPNLIEMVVPMGSKFGKTMGAASAEVAAAWSRKDCLFRHVAPIYSQAKIGMRYAERLAPRGRFKTDRSDPPRIIFPQSRSLIEYWHGKNPESLEGEGVHGYVFDEAAKMTREVYDSAKTTVTFTKGPFILISTPKGKGWFYKRAMDCKERMEWAIAKGKIPQYVFLTAPTIANPFIDPAVIAEHKRNMSDRLFRQYWLAEFVDDGDVFVGFRKLVYGEPLIFDGPMTLWTHEDATEYDVVIGADWGKINDFTVFTAMTYGRNRKLVGFQRFNNMSYIEAIKQLVLFSKMFKKTHLVYHDITGVGQGIDDMLAQVNLPVEGVTFTNQSKTDMVNDLILTFERKELELPNWGELIQELDSYEVSTTMSGNFRYQAAGSMHDDIVSSLMLANAGAREYGGDFSIRFVEDLPADKSKMTLDKWYSDLIDDASDGPF